jgi:hypothetical protein
MLLSLKPMRRAADHVDAEPDDYSQAIRTLGES